MRPRPWIALLGVNVDGLSALRFVLTTHGYGVVSGDEPARMVAPMRAAADRNLLRVVVVDWQAADRAPALMAPFAGEDVRLVLINVPEWVPLADISLSFSAVVRRNEAANTELMQVLKRQCARKTGPKPRALVHVMHASGAVNMNGLEVRCA